MSTRDMDIADASYGRVEAYSVQIITLWEIWCRVFSIALAKKRKEKLRVRLDVRSIRISGEHLRLVGEQNYYSGAYRTSIDA